MFYPSVYQAIVKAYNVAYAIELANYYHIDLIEGMKEWTIFQDDMAFGVNYSPF